MRVFSPTDRELGELGEEIAARHLLSQGWRILGRRVRTPRGEIDLLARDGSTVVCVEVKTGRIEPVPRPRGRPRGEQALPPDLELRWRPGARLGAAQIARLRAAARSLRGGGRVDLVEVLLDVRARRFRVLHHPDLRRPLA